MKRIRLLIQLVFIVTFFIVLNNGNMFLWLGLFIASLFCAIIFGRFYCGYICPMNTVMGISTKISKEFNWQTKTVPKVFESKALPWLVLLMMVATVVLSKKIFHFEIPILIILMSISIIITLRFEERVFHNQICPYGALLKLTGRWAIFSTTVDESQCIGCRKCEQVCPTKAIIVAGVKNVVLIDTALCLQCYECTYVCPKNAIHYCRR